MATLKDVAKLANVDVSTVSRALNNTSYVHPDTRARIIKAVEELSYQPNILARGLRQGKRNTIAVIVPKLSFSIFEELTAGIQDEAQKRGYSTILCNTDDDKITEKECLNRLRNTLVDGIIIAGTGYNKRLVRDMSADGMPVVQVIRQLDSNLCSVTVDNVSVGYQAVQHLISKGCQNIGLINGSMQISPYAERYQGYSKAIRENKLAEITVELSSKTRGAIYGHDCTERLLDQNAKLDAILAATDAQGMGVLRALKENGLQVPQDIRVISMTGYRIGEMLETTLTSMELPGFEIGVSAANMAIAAIETDKSQPIAVRHVSFSAVLTPRESTM